MTEIPVENYVFTPEKRVPDDDTRRIQQVADFERAASSAVRDEVGYIIERIMINLANLELVTKFRHVEALTEVKNNILAIREEEV